MRDDANLSGVDRPLVGTPRPVRLWARWGIMAVFAVAPVVGYLAPLGLWIPWACLALIILWHDAQRRSHDDARGVLRVALNGAKTVFRQPLSFFLGLPVLGLLTSFWSLVPDVSAVRSVALIVQIVLGVSITLWLCRLPEPERRLFVAVAGLSATGMGALMVLDIALGAPLASLLHGQSPYVIGGESASRGAVFNGMILFPACAALWGLRRYWGAVSLLAAGLVVVHFHASETAAVASLLAVGVAGVLALLPRLVVLLAPAAVLIQLGMPVLVEPINEVAYCRAIEEAPSMVHRFVIWQHINDLIWQRPLLGWGLDAARLAPGGKEKVSLRACDAAGNPTGPIKMTGQAIPLHPHNGALDIWFSLGVVGAMAGAYALWEAFAAARRMWPGRLGAALIGAMSCQILLTVSLGYGLWQGWFVSAICLSLCCFAVQGRVATQTGHHLLKAGRHGDGTVKKGRDAND